MPTSEELLAGLTQISNDAFALAVLWHVAVLAALVALAAGWRPSRRLAALLLALPLASVGVLALAYGNLWNGTIFVALAATLGALGVGMGEQPVTLGPTWRIVAGTLLVGFGLVYPHFLQGRPVSAYLYGAPLGLVPCPTLSLVIGAGLVAAGLGSRAWSIVVGAVGLFYGAFGAVRLGVRIDLVLLAGALLLLLGAFAPGRARGPRRSAAGVS